MLTKQQARNLKVGRVLYYADGYYVKIKLVSVIRVYGTPYMHLTCKVIETIGNPYKHSIPKQIVVFYRDLYTSLYLCSDYKKFVKRIIKDVNDSLSFHRQEIIKLEEGKKEINRL